MKTIYIYLECSCLEQEYFFPRKLQVINEILNTSSLKFKPVTCLTDYTLWEFLFRSVKGQAIFDSVNVVKNNFFLKTPFSFQATFNFCNLILVPEFENVTSKTEKGWRRSKKFLLAVIVEPPHQNGLGSAHIVENGILTSRK